MSKYTVTRMAVALAIAISCDPAFSQALEPVALASAPADANLPIISGVDPGSVPLPWEPTKPAAPPVRVQRVPALEGQGGTAPVAIQTTPPPPVNLLANVDSTLTDRERSTVAKSKRWIDGPREGDSAGTGDNGAVVFRFGGALPTVVCAPLYVCQVTLQAGEVVNGIDVGDSVRWKISPAVSGDGAGRTIHVVIKPQDIGLTTNLLVTTDRRVYNMKLVSRRDDWMPAIAFSYPEDEAAAWAAVKRDQAKHIAANVLPQTGQSIGKLDFGYRMRGDSPAWRPVRVYNDGRQTFIQFPPAMAATEAPALVALGDAKEQLLVNYRVVDDRFVVDKVLDGAMLVSGVGRKQTSVRIERER